MTLVELLITILIIGLLAGMILGVAAVAGETAREAKTRRVVNQLHTLLTEHYETYKTRRVKVRPEVMDEIDSLSGAQRGRALAEARLYALRELMLMEMPDRWSDVLLATVGDAPADPIYVDAPLVRIEGYEVRRTPLAANYLRRYFQGRRRMQEAGHSPEDINRMLFNNQGAECLYMIITLATGDGEARGMFGESVIGDVDGNGAPEFLDGWGQPINFIRWAPGFDSEIQLNANVLWESMSESERRAAIGADPDPFDMFRVDVNAFRLVPLIYSPGRDNDYGLVFRFDDLAPWPAPGSDFFGFPRLTPHIMRPTGSFLGADLGGSTDNVHNHLIGTR